MLLIWKGWGWVSLPLALTTMIVGVVIAKDSPEFEYVAAGLGLIVGGILIAAIALIVLPMLARRRKLSTEFWTVQKNHSLFFVPMLIWSPVAIILGIVLTMYTKEPIQSY